MELSHEWVHSEEQASPYTDDRVRFFCFSKFVNGRQSNSEDKVGLYTTIRYTGLQGDNQNMLTGHYLDNH